MAAKHFYLGAGADGNFAAMTETAQTAALRTDGWTVAKIASGNSSTYVEGTKNTSSTFSSQSTTPKPASFVTSAGADAFKTAVAYNGIFANANWSIQFAVRASSAASSQAGRVRLRVF